MTSVSGYLATQMNSTIVVESERYSDHFNPIPAISNDTSAMKLKPDNMKGTGTQIEFLNAFPAVICSFVFCLITCNYVFYWLYFELVRSLVYNLRHCLQS